MTGILLRQPFFNKYKDEHLFKDLESFHLPEEEEYNQLIVEEFDGKGAIVIRISLLL